MKTIYKYELEIGSSTHLKLPDKAKIVHIGEQNEKLMAWIELQTLDPVYFKTIYAIRTGWDVMPDINHVGSVQMSNGLVWHVFVQER